MQKTQLMMIWLGTLILWGGFFSNCFAESFPYNFIIPSAADLPQALAEQYAIDYYNQHTAQGYYDGDDTFSGIETISGRYFLNSNLIRFFHETKEQY